MPLPGMISSLGPTGSISGGFVEVAATITAIVNVTFYATDKMGKQYDNLMYAIGSGPKPQVGEIWMMEKKSTGWCFSYPIISNPRIISTTAAITAINGQTILVDAIDEPVTVTLTPSVDATVTIKVLSIRTNAVTVISAGGENVEDVSAYTLNARQSATFSFNVNWWITNFLITPTMTFSFSASTSIVSTASAVATIT